MLTEARRRPLLSGAGQLARKCCAESAFSEGEKVRLIAALILIFAFHGQVIAQTVQCQFVPKASDRLACYDRATPPTAAPKTPAVTGKAAAASSPADQAQVVDMLAAENSKLDANLKTICRGC